jgi:RecJ-like exonuclease
MTNRRKEENPMLKEYQQRIVKVDCSACNGNGSLNSYDFYSCPICLGVGFVEVQALEEVQFPLCNPVADKKEPVKEVNPMLKEVKQRIGLAECWACNGSLNFYDSYSCPICQGVGFVEVQALEEVLFPEAKSYAQIQTLEEAQLPPDRSIADGYEFCVEHL